MSKRRKNTIIIVLLALVIFIGYYAGLVNLLEQGLLKLFSPVQQQLYNWSLVLKKINNLGEILEENTYLKSELSKLVVDYVKLSNIESENEYLKKELDYLKENKYNYQIAGVIGGQPYQGQILFINKGSQDGLLENLAVTAGQGIIIGKVVSVLPRRSQVQLLTDPDSRLAASFSQQTGTQGLVRGKAGSSLIMEFVPQNLEIKEGDLVITSGLEENIPRGLLVGRVTEVNNLAGQIFQQVNILTPFNYQNFSTLTIIMPASDDINE
ncbi:rod shape-determining protein MreC [Patescibacteria group bacterium]|nr:rod shape-determining protein MreC [Patescibacteria group bacterium]